LSSSSKSNNAVQDLSQKPSELQIDLSEENVDEDDISGEESSDDVDVTQLSASSYLTTQRVGRDEQDLINNKNTPSRNITLQKSRIDKAINQLENETSSTDLLFKLILEQNRISAEAQAKWQRDMAEIAASREHEYRMKELELRNKINN